MFKDVCERDGLRFLPLISIAILSACSSDAVNLGGGDMPQITPRGSRCRESTVIDEAVRVTNAGELADLAGCEEIRGGLVIEVFEAANDLSPLAALRVIDGGLQIGAFPDRGNEIWDEAERGELRDQFNRGIEDGYFESLEGLDSLEQVGSLAIAHVEVASLAALSNLRSVSVNTDTRAAGMLDLQFNPNLRSLDGLENVGGIQHLIVNENRSLAELSGIQLGPILSNVNILGSPLLETLDELSLVEYLNTLYLVDLGIRNLDELVSLRQVEFGINLAENAELEQVDALAPLWSAGSVNVRDNPKLARLPAFPDLSTVDAFRVVGNAELAAIALGLPLSIGGPVLRGDPVEPFPRIFEIGENPKLQSVSLSAGLENAQYVAIHENAILGSVDLGSLRHLDTLSITGNPTLGLVAASALETVDWLSIVDNPLLPTAALEMVRTFEAEFSGNAPVPAPTPVPAPDLIPAAAPAP
jgi:hypothetical protein